MSRDEEQELVAKLDAARAAKARMPLSLWDLVQSIHSEPPMRDWVTLESQPLCPLAAYPADESGRREALIYLLLACPAERGVLHQPWGLLVWRWPSRRIPALLDVRNLLPSPAASLTVAHLASREFLEGVQEAIEHGAPVPPPPEPLPDLYRKVLEILPLHKSTAGSPARRTTPPRRAQPKAGPSKKLVAEQVRPSRRPPHIPDLMTRTKNLIEEASQDALLGEWRRIYARLNRTGFSVAVAGEFNRGKSTLINRILDEDLLPTGDLPTTAMVARVLYSTRRALWHILPGPRRERKELTEESWYGLTAQDDDIDPEGVVEVELPHPWLKQTGIQFVDTPGAGDLTGNRAALAIDAIGHCDATLVTVSASMPLSLTERSFVDEHVLSRRMPKVAVVLARLDQIPGPDRLGLVTFVKNKLQEWAPQAELWCTHGAEVLPKDAPVAVSGPEGIRNRLAEWASNPSHVRLRGLQVISQLRELVEALCGVLSAELAATCASKEEREKAVRLSSEELARRKLGWEDLRLEMAARGRAVGQWLEEAIEDARPQLADALTYELEHTSNPKEWWEKDLPYRLRRELLIMSRPLNQRVRQRVSEDASWLHTHVKEQFSWTLQLPTPEEPTALREEDFSSVIAQLRGVHDLSAIRLWTRLGLGALTLAGLLFPVTRLVALPGAMVGGVASETLFKGKIERQKRSASVALKRVAADLTREGARRVIDSLQKYYQAILEEAMKQESLWFRARQETLLRGEARGAMEDEDRSVAETRDRLDRADLLACELAEWLDEGAQ